MKTFILVFILLSLIIPPSFATEEFATQTKRECSICHIDPSGGGELTAAGSGYDLFLATDENRVPVSASISIFKFFIGFIHLATGFLWFGTILYVHLILKPAYASRGLPHGEVKVGLWSMAIMAVTGAILTWIRVPDLAFLIETRFGILLLSKIALFLVMVLTALYVVIFIGPKLRQSRQTEQIGPDAESDEITPEQLEGFDGKDGHAARIAYQDRIFDVTRSRLWKNGNHVGRHEAGADLTSMMKNAPHGPEVLERVPEVGHLLNKKAPVPLHQKVFICMAYLNLSIVFIITFIIALWRWG